jgi:hypothetical protein
VKLLNTAGLADALYPGSSGRDAMRAAHCHPSDGPGPEAMGGYPMSRHLAAPTSFAVAARCDTITRSDGYVTTECTLLAWYLSAAHVINHSFGDALRRAAATGTARAPSDGDLHFTFPATGAIGQVA